MSGAGCSLGLQRRPFFYVGRHRTGLMQFLD